MRRHALTAYKYNLYLYKCSVYMKVVGFGANEKSDFTVKKRAFKSEKVSFFKSSRSYHFLAK